MRVNLPGGPRDVKAVWWEAGEVRMIDQRALPERFEILPCRSVEDVARAIESMAVRGAPAIGVTAAYGVALAGETGAEAAIGRLGRTRPTGRDLFHALDWMAARARSGGDLVEAAKAYAAAGEETCRLIGMAGEPLLPEGCRVLTHCNAGALATGDHGTATAPMRRAHELGRRLFVWVSETRPRLQGARLTAWELAQEGIDHAILADGACGVLFARKQVDLVLVGADRITASGDFANKVGTYEKAVLAREHGVPFYVAAPLSTFDLATERGEAIPIEERSEEEVTEVGGVAVANPGSRAFNPAFDVTPARLVTAFVTEKGIMRPEQVRSLRR
jgi:S-methyl-5-thioribose-1-phosphate isomerase